MAEVLRIQSRRPRPRPAYCTDPWRYVWCKGSIPAGDPVSVLVEDEGRTTWFRGLLCTACADHARAQGRAS